MKLPKNEMGFAMCRGADGKLVAGPTAWGTPTSVAIPVQCPTGADFIGLFHTHPGGVSFPSAQDIASALRVGGKTLCIESEADGLKCFRIEG